MRSAPVSCDHQRAAVMPGHRVGRPLQRGGSWFLRRCSLYWKNRMAADNDRLLYAPEPFAARNPVAIVQKYPFAMLITSSAAGILATSTPIFFETDDDRSTLVGHVARRNPQAGSLEMGQPALAVFSGPHTYISASWYEARPTVPTWNYVCAHVRGRLEPIDDAEQTLAILRRTAAVMERDSEHPWTIEQAPAGRVEFLLPQIRAFRISVERIEGVTKLNQTHPASDRVRVIRQLLDRGDEGSREIARLMAERD
jgi:transcriptional regulator